MKEKFKKIIKNNKIYKYHEQRKRINTLENENEILKETIKSELYKNFMENTEKDLILQKLKKENKMLRAKNKELKGVLKGV